MSWLLAFVGFALLVILHELGHFTAAKWVGMRVERFSLFFPPILAKKKIGETEYCIGSIPAGGYVKITGMNPDEKLPDEVRDRAYHAQPVWKRIVVIAAGPAVNLVIALRAAVRLLRRFIGDAGRHQQGRRDRAAASRPRRRSSPGDKIIAVDGKQRRAGAALAPDPVAQVLRHAARRRLQGDDAGQARRRARRRARARSSSRPSTTTTSKARPGARGSASPTRPAGRARRCRSGEAAHGPATRFWFFTGQTRRRCPRGCSTRRSARRSAGSWAPTRSRGRRSSTTSPTRSGSSRSSRCRSRS